jgi:C1A family cysteine protease
MTFKYDARPDAADFRDLLYQPSLINVPATIPVGTFMRRHVPVMNQGAEGACTGFGLATVVHYLMRTRAGANDKEDVSPRMLYEMAKLNDRWWGEDYSGSSCRGAIKGWHKNGVCSEALWPYKPDDTDKTLTTERAENAAQRPLGAYYRVNTHDLTHVHTALTEVGVLYVSAKVHTGWQKVGGDGKVSLVNDEIGGHAFVLIGYDELGFWFQNSWGTRWGFNGLGHLSYADWLKNGQDAWVCRAGVPVSL